MSDLVKELMPYLQKLADKLDSSAQVLWALQMGQVKVSLISYVLQYITWLVMTFIFYKIWIIAYKKCNGVWEIKTGHYSWEQNYTRLWWVTLIFSIITLVYFMFLPSIKTIMTLIYNPEFWALQEIIKMVK